MKLFAFFGLLLLLVMPAHAQDDAALEDVPYIYYYSGALNGIVIERADGTDSRIIGQGLIDEPAKEVLGPGWSPDGRWFAWRKINPGAYTHDNGKGYVVSIDGGSLDLLDAFQCVYRMDWHPTDNILLVHGTVDEHTECQEQVVPLVVTYWLVNADTQTLLSSFSIESTQGFGYLPVPIYWYPENDYIQFVEASTLVADNRRMYWITMHYSGKVTIEPISSETYNERFEYPELSLMPDAYIKRFGSSPDDFPFVERFMGDGQSLPFDVPPNSDAAGPYSYVSWLWHSSEEWLFTGYESCFAGCSYVTGRVNVFNPSTGHNREISDCKAHRACVGWLPERVPVDDLPPGQETSVLPTPVAYENDTHRSFIVPAWTHQLICNTDTNERSLVNNRDTGEVDFVLPIGEDCHPLTEDPTRAYENEIIFAHSPDERSYAITNRSEYTSLYDAQTGGLIATLNFCGGELSFSEDSRYLITVGRATTATWDIQELIANHAESPPAE